MEQKSAKYIIVGAGLSGLTAAYQLLKAGEKDFFVLESRDRIGGRILTNDKIDFGATWFQNHHNNVSALLKELNIAKFLQYSKGRSVLVYSTMAPEHYFDSDPNAPSAFRIVNNSQSMIQNLADTMPNKIRVETVVKEISDQKDKLFLETNKGTFAAEKVILTVPPKIANTIKYSPELPNELVQVMEKTHTWMSNAIKVGLTFETPFWRDKNLSGTVIGQVGAVTELYDHTDVEDDNFALMGFVNEGLRDVSSPERKARILEYLSKYLGQEIMDFKTYEEKDWSKDMNTSNETIKSVYLSPSYGDSAFKEMYLKGKLLFSGAETSPVHGGYMDGAIYSGLFAAKKILS